MAAASLEKIKVLLSLPPEPSEADHILSVMAEDAESAVKEYCHIRKIPAGLEYIVRELVVHAYKADNGGNVASIKRGDTQINYSTMIAADSFSIKQMQVLNGYRRLRIG